MIYFSYAKFTLKQVERIQKYAIYVINFNIRINYEQFRLLNSKKKKIKNRLKHIIFLTRE